MLLLVIAACLASNIVVAIDIDQSPNEAFIWRRKEGTSDPVLEGSKEILLMRATIKFDGHLNVLQLSK